MKLRCNLTPVMLGILAGPILLLSVVTFGFLEDGYSHMNNSVSSLGALAAQNTLLFNLVGLLTPGLLVAVSFYVQYSILGRQLIDRIIYFSVVVFGVMFAGLALPMDLDPIPRLGVTAHYILAYTSVAPFLLSASLMVYKQRKKLSKAPLIWVFPAVFIIIEISGAFGVGGGLVQRGLLVCIFLWISVVCFQSRAVLVGGKNV